MDWVNRMNAAVDYVEAHLAEELDPDAISRIMACPYSVFLRSFAQIAGVSLAEYVRRRRLTLAAQDLRATDVKVIDVAVKYGYGSADAFRVAFKKLHGVLPSNAKVQELSLTFYCKLSFALSIKGVEKMEYRYTTKPAFQVVGKRRTTPYGGGTWAIVKSDGSGEILQQLCGRMYDLGLCFGFGEDGSNDYMCAVEWDGGELSGFDYYAYPQADWLLFKAEGTITGQTLTETWNRINNEFLPQSGYQKSGLPTIEKYVRWDESTDECEVEIWIPIRRTDN